jgi:hypothetical protein
MRKTLFILSLLTAFCLAAFIGFSTAAHSSASGDPSSQTAPSTPPSASQQNILLVYVDRLDGTKPVLRSLWVASYFKSSNQTVLKFTPLFPLKTKDKLADMDKSFTQNEDGSLSKQFTRRIAAADIQSNGFMIIDEAGTLQVNQWLRDQGVPVFAQSSEAPQILLETACRFISGEASSGDASSLKFDWDTFGAHFQTDVPLSTLMATWDEISAPTRPTRCEVAPE